MRFFSFTASFYYPDEKRAIDSHGEGRTPSSAVASHSIYRQSGHNHRTGSNRSVPQMYCIEKEFIIPVPFQRSTTRSLRRHGNRRSHHRYNLLEYRPVRVPRTYRQPVSCRRCRPDYFRLMSPRIPLIVTVPSFTDNGKAPNCDSVLSECDPPQGASHYQGVTPLPNRSQ